MGVWNTHGMAGDAEDQRDAVDVLALIPEEIEALVKYANMERQVFEHLATRKSGQEKRKCTLIARHWSHRMRRWKELSAQLEHDLTSEV